MTRVLVAGGAGFLGSNLCERLLERGRNVLCLDNFSTGRPKNVEHLLNLPNFQMIAGDVRDPPEIEVDEIYNLACPASPNDYQAAPIATMTTCVLGSLRLLDLARTNKARVFFASTSEIYGQPEVHPQSESYAGNVDTTGPRACYNEGKRAAETLHLDFARLHGVEVRIARIFNTYGPRLFPRDGRVVSSLVCQALLGQPLTVHGDGTQTRSFCYVDDLLDSITALMGSHVEVPINLGNADEIEILDLAERILDLTGSRSPIQLLPGRQDDPRQRKPDLTRAHNFLGYWPRVDLNTGLQRTIDWFRQELAVKEQAA